MSRKTEYDIDGLRSSVDHCKKTIKVLQEAMAEQQTQISNYRKMIETLERKQALSEGVTIDAKAGR